MPLRENFLYTLKAGPAGGLRPPSGPAATRRSPGSPPHRSLTLDRQGQRVEHVVLVRPPIDERGELNTLYSQEMSTISVVTNHAIRHSCASRTNTKADQVQAGPPVRLGLVSGTPAGCQREGGAPHGANNLSAHGHSHPLRSRPSGGLGLWRWR